MKLSVKKGDTVIILTGKDKGQKGKIISADPSAGKVRVENANMVSKHKKARSAKDTGGIVKMEGPIDVSNVQIVCAACGKQTRIGHAINDSGKKIRQCKKCGASLDVKAEKAKKSAKKDKKAVEAKSGDDTAKTAKKETAKKTTAKKTKDAKTTGDASAQVKE